MTLAGLRVLGAENCHSYKWKICFWSDNEILADWICFRKDEFQSGWQKEQLEWFVKRLIEDQDWESVFEIQGFFISFYLWV